MSDQPPADLGPDSALPPESPAAVPSAPAAMSAAMQGQIHAELSSIVLAAQPLGAVLRRVAELAVTSIPGADDASVTLIEQGKPRTVAFVGQLAVTLDERQYEAGFGPCMDAATGGQMIHVDTADESGAYLGFARQARRQGVRHVLALGLPTLQQTSGALNLYANGGPFTPQAHEIASAFAGYAAVTLFNATVYAGALDEVIQMKTAIASRAVIEQAKGIVMAQQHCTADEAFAVLVKTSSIANRKVRDIAFDIVERAITG